MTFLDELLIITSVVVVNRSAVAFQNIATSLFKLTNIEYKYLELYKYEKVSWESSLKFAV